MTDSQRSRVVQSRPLVRHPVLAALGGIVGGGVAGLALYGLHVLVLGCPHP